MLDFLHGWVTFQCFSINLGVFFALQLGFLVVMDWMFVSRIHMLKPWPSVWWCFGGGAFGWWLTSDEPSEGGEGPSWRDLCPCKKGPESYPLSPPTIWGHREKHHLQARKRPLTRGWPLCDLRLPNLKNCKTLMLFKPPSLWCFVATALTDWDSCLPFFFEVY